MERMNLGVVTLATRSKQDELSELMAMQNAVMFRYDNRS